MVFSANDRRTGLVRSWSGNLCPVEILCGLLWCVHVWRTVRRLVLDIQGPTDTVWFANPFFYNPIMGSLENVAVCLYGTGPGDWLRASYSQRIGTPLRWFAFIRGQRGL